VATIRTLMKFWALSAFALYGWVRLKLNRSPTLVILTYHRVLPEGSPERELEQPGMIVSPENLQRHINLMRSLGATPVHLEEWLHKRRIGESLPTLAVAFSFDDGWRDNYVHGYPLLSQEKVPATIFLVTQMIDTDKTFWPEQVLKLVISTRIALDDESFEWLHPHLPASITGGERRPLSLVEGDEVISRLKSMDDVTILRNLEKVYQAHPDLAPTDTSRAILNTPELEAMACDGLMKYGAHTRHHYRLNRLNDEHTLEEEIAGCREDMKALGKAASPIFCYPNGDITGDGEALVTDHYEAACTTKTGWNRDECDPYDLRRFNLHDGNSYNNRTLLATIGRGLL